MTDSLSRRRFLRGAATTITAASSIGLVACGSDGGNTPAAPETPAPAPVAAFLHGVASGDPLADVGMAFRRHGGRTQLHRVGQRTRTGPGAPGQGK